MLWRKECGGEEAMSDSQKKITLIIGLGEVGGPLRTVLQRQDHETIGVEFEPSSIAAPIGIMHICFPFIDQGQFQDAVIVYAHKCDPEVIVINSTVVPGTTRAIENACGIPCVYSPVRGKHTEMLDELCTYVKFVAGTNARATERVMEHFRSAGMHSEAMSAPEALELAKLLETTYFGLLIAWAQEMNRFAHTVNADYQEIGRFFREISYLPGVLFRPGYIGGHCVMPNVELLQQQFQSDFLDAIKESNEVRKRELEAARQQSAGKRLQPIALK
jgi:UDP-N-acetyl-D-mannosaminuronate dehydrogenase